MTVPDKDFSLSSYRELVMAMVDRGYQPISFGDVRVDAPHLILRHDIDFDLSAAVAMAETEHAAGIASTYFVLLRTEFYNPFSGAGIRAIRELREHGHEVGLHFDASAYDLPETDFPAVVAHECELLQHVVDAPVTVFSLHRPTQTLLDFDLSVEGLINSYGLTYFRNMGYCSDSRGAWHHGYPLDHPAVAGGRALQLLTHPIWWVGDAGQTPRARLECFLDNQKRRLKEELAHHSSVFEGESFQTRE